MFNVAPNSTFEPERTSFQTNYSTVDVIHMVLLVSIFVVGVAGNVLVIYIFGIKAGTKRKRFEAFLLVLGIVDFISSTVVPLSFLYLTITNYQEWHFGLTGCKIIPSLLQISITVSQGVLILICYERYQAIVHPFTKRLSLLQVALWLIFICILATILSIPYAMTLEIVQDDYYKIRTCTPDSNQGGTLLASACVNLLKDVSAAFILIYLSYHMRLCLVKEYTNITWNRSHFSEKGRRLMILVIVVFLLLTFPVDIYRVGVLSLFLCKVEISQTAYNTIVMCNTFLNILQMCSSVVNVFIYSKVHQNFLLNLPSCLKKRKQSFPNSNGSGIGTEINLFLALTASNMVQQVDEDGLLVSHV